VKKIRWLLAVVVFAIVRADASNLTLFETTTNTSQFAPFTDPLPIPPRLVIPKDQSDVTIRLSQFGALVYPGSKVTTQMWGYNGTSPGPVIEVEKDQLVRIHWKNELPKTHLLPAPKDMMNTGPLPGERTVMDGPKTVAEANEMPGMNPGAMSGAGNLPEVRNITHLHGAAVWELNPMDRLHNNDGWPDAWNVPGEEQIAEYPNAQDARTLWYHDHAVGETGRNVAAGLVGMYIIHDSFERSLNLPSGKYEIPLILQTLGIKPNGSLFYTNEISTEFYGNAATVNGKILPYLSVEPRKYRFRILNASNSRMYGLKLVESANRTEPGPGFYQIGTDAGFLEKTALLNDPTEPNAPLLFLASAERADVIVDFSKSAGKQFILSNTNSITDPDGEIPLAQIMLFKVEDKVTEEDTSSLPMNIRPIKRLNPEQVAQTRKILITETDYSNGTSLFQLNKRSWYYKKTDDQGDYWDYEIDTKPVIGTSETWELVNTTVMIHPFHVHLVQFQILDRRPFDVDQYNLTGKVVFTGPAVPPDPNESGWKDVVRSNPRQITRIIMRFEPYPGYYVYHCHLLEHEDMDMMIPFQVVAPFGLFEGINGSGY